MNITTRYKVKQSSKGNTLQKDYYDWEIWIEDGDQPITGIEMVEYLLHPTFPNRHRSSSDVDRNFILKSSGWGEFMIRVIIHEKSGESIHISHWLNLSDKQEEVLERSGLPPFYEGLPDLKVKPASIGSEESGPVKTVYLSYSSADAKFAKYLEAKLIDLGLKVKTPASLPVGTTIKEYINQSIVSSDALIEIVFDQESTWQKQEVEIANQASVPTISIKGLVKRAASELKKQGIDFDELLNDQDIRSIAERIRNEDDANMEKFFEAEI